VGCAQAGSAISIADLQIVCELEQLRMLEGAEQGPYMQELMAPHPLVQQYMARVRQVRRPQQASTAYLPDWRGTSTIICLCNQWDLVSCVWWDVQELSPHYAPVIQTLCRAAEASKTRKESQSKL
jgi:hypothetical protein